MNIEVEIKIKVDDFTETEKILSSKGKLVKKIRQIDEYYVPVQRDFFAQKPFPVEWLRIRTNPDKVIFEYDKSIGKDDRGSQEYSEEYETEISSPEELKKILNFLDFKKVVTIDKQRQYWDCGQVEVVLDEVKDLGKFVEIEAKGDFASHAAAKAACFDFLAELKINNPQEINKGYPDLLLEKLKL